MKYTSAMALALACVAATAAAQAPAPAAGRPTVNQRGLQCDTVEGADIQKMTADQRLGLYCGYEMAQNSVNDAVEKASGRPTQSDLTRQERCSRGMNRVTDVMMKNRELPDCTKVAGYRPGAPKAP